MQSSGRRIGRPKVFAAPLSNINTPHQILRLNSLWNKLIFQYGNSLWRARLIAIRTASPR